MRERKCGLDTDGLLQKRWENFRFHEPDGEPLGMLQSRNIAALKEILDVNEGKNIVIGTHGSALSTILNYYNPAFDCNAFLRIVNWMPYIIELDFIGQNLSSVTEIGHVEK